MAKWDLQRLTNTVDYIDHEPTPRCVLLPARRHHTTQKVKIAGPRTLYISVHNKPHPKELFLRVKGLDVTSKTVGIARLMSLALQSPLETVGDLLADAKCAPCGWHLETECWR